MRIIFIKQHKTYNNKIYNPGDMIWTDDNRAQILIDSKTAKKYDDPKPELRFAGQHYKYKKERAKKQ